MRKANFPQGKVDLKKIIIETQKNPYLSNILVTVDNLNDCLVYIKEKENCQNCSGLKNCRNHQVGYFPLFDNLNQEFYLQRCSRKREEDIKNNELDLIKTLYMPKRIKEAELKDFSIVTKERQLALKKSLEFIREYDNNKFKKGLFITGIYSSGKTFLLAGIAKELAKKNLSTLLIYFPDLIREFKNSLGTERFEQLINQIKDVDVLMIDDFGSETMSFWLRDEILGPILNYRVAEGKAFFFSTNLTYDQIVSHLTLENSPIDKTKVARIISRINEGTDFITLGKEPYYSLKNN